MERDLPQFLSLLLFVHSQGTQVHEGTHEQHDDRELLCPPHLAMQSVTARPTGKQPNIPKIINYFNPSTFLYPPLHLRGKGGQEWEEDQSSYRKGGGSLSSFFPQSSPPRLLLPWGIEAGTVNRGEGMRNRTNRLYPPRRGRRRRRRRRRGPLLDSPTGGGREDPSSIPQ